MSNFVKFLGFCNIRRLFATTGEPGSEAGAGFHRDPCKLWEKKGFWEFRAAGPESTAPGTPSAFLGHWGWFPVDIRAPRSITAAPGRYGGTKWTAASPYRWEGGLLDVDFKL